MPADALWYYQALGTVKTATFQTAAKDSKVGFYNRPCWVHVFYKLAANASGSNTWTFGIDVSQDGATWYSNFVSGENVLTLTTTNQQGSFYIPFITKLRYSRFVGTLAGGGTSPTIAVGARLELVAPG